MNNTEEQKLAVMFVGGLNDCKYTMKILDGLGFPCALDVAEKMGPQYANRGYYIITMPEENAVQAKQLMEQKIREDLEINDSPGNLDDKCPACGAELTIDNTECPDCGLNFG